MLIQILQMRFWYFLRNIADADQIIILKKTKIVALMEKSEYWPPKIIGPS